MARLNPCWGGTFVADAGTQLSKVSRLRLARESDLWKMQPLVGDERQRRSAHIALLLTDA
jgi:hypothetical protein